MTTSSHIAQKSINNSKASELLIENGLFSSSVHCSYYCALQFLIDKYAEVLNRTFEEISLETSGGKGTHNYIINGILSYIRKSYSDDNLVMKNVKNTNYEKLKRTIKDLKNFRVLSDYHNCKINYDTSIKAQNKCSYILKTTKEFLS